MAQRKKSYLFSWEQYRDEAWWNNIRVETTRQGLSINQLLCDLLDRWLAGGDAAPDMLYALNEIRALWDKHGLGNDEQESGPVYRLMVEAIRRGEGK
jgi:hypothetical protein